ncbi:MAG: folylpolyglutamate synthase/dihydrofolate synthase family protein [Oscillospiraceae bacterium]|nr:folylpolyglutamate synthase/dihydrofolate synthase family protein [Oscillospiraceae bacterium]
MNFEEAVKYISDAACYGIVPGLESMTRLCRELSNPQDKLKIIHIAGTNGKGSTGAFINNILIKAGYRTGRYSSPSVIDYLDKIQIGTTMISKEDFCLYTQKVKNAVDAVVEKGFSHPTVFEIETAVAFSYFADQHCDIVLIEAGMGGKSDATNVIKKSILSVITSISMDHTKYLGDTLEKIAVQKAGIIKRNSNVATISQQPKVISVILNTCNDKRAQLKIAKIYNIENYSCSTTSQTFDYKRYKNIKINMIGKFQVENAALAVEACEILDDTGYSIDETAIYSGLAETVWPARFEIISADPLFIIDGAHNEAAAARLRETIDICFSDKKIIYIMGTFKDKNYPETVRLTAKRASKIYTVTPDLTSRSLPAQELAAVIKTYNPNVTACSSVKEAVDESLKSKYHMIIAFGSLSFLGQIRKYIKEVKPDAHQI